MTMLCKEGLLCEVEREIEMLATDMREIEGMLFLSNILGEILSGWKTYSKFVFLRGTILNAFNLEERFFC